MCGLADLHFFSLPSHIMSSGQVIRIRLILLINFNTDIVPRTACSLGMANVMTCLLER